MYLFASNKRGEIRCVVGDNYILVLYSASYKGPVLRRRETKPSNVRRVVALSLSDCYEIGAEAFIDQEFHAGPDNSSRVVLLDEIGLCFSQVGDFFHLSRKG